MLSPLSVKLFLILLLSKVVCPNAFSQSVGSDSTQARRFDIIPVISYSPETSLTLGVLGFWYPDLAHRDPDTKQSNVSFLAFYTLKNQTQVETNWDLFTDGNEMRFQGGLGFSRFPNRNYGLGNNADAEVTEYEFTDGALSDSTLNNYKRYSIMSVYFQPTVLWELRDNLYGGGVADLEYAWNFEELGDSIGVTSGSTDFDVLERNATGMRAGLGFSLIWDSRDYLLSSSSGSFVSLNTMFYGGYLGSKYNYYSILLDGRKYFNTTGRQTLAVRGVANFRGTGAETLPLRGLSAIGGSRLGRGYFEGTFQDNNLIALQTEYRIPFWKPGNVGPIYQYWKRLAMTVFASGAQVFGREGSFGISNFNFATGAGIRFLFNEQSRAYLRIDYAFGLTANAGGVDELQSGLYFSFGEAF